MAEFVTRDYVIVFFGGGMKHKPALGWMIDAYKRLSRDYKKNVKKLYVVHPTWWFKLAVFFMQNLTSSKFAKKIINVEKLKDLPSFVPMQSIVIPEEVKIHDEKKGNEPVTATALGAPVTGNRARARGASSGGVKHAARRRGDVIFGGKQVTDAESAEEEAPEPILNLINFIHTNGLEEVEIFRKSPNTADIVELKDRLDRGILRFINRL
jgi:Rho GTPase-activating protein 1